MHSTGTGLRFLELLLRTEMGGQVKAPGDHDSSSIDSAAMDLMARAHDSGPFAIVHFKSDMRDSSGGFIFHKVDPNSFGDSSLVLSAATTAGERCAEALVTFVHTDVVDAPEGVELSAPLAGFIRELSRVSKHPVYVVLHPQPDQPGVSRTTLLEAGISEDRILTSENEVRDVIDGRIES